MLLAEQEKIRHHVRDTYARVAKTSRSHSRKTNLSAQDEKSGCCGKMTVTSCCRSDTPNEKKVSKGLGYSETDVQEVPEGANMGLGCGNPQAIAALQKGEIVLDLGSGGGFDCFLPAKRVGPKGRVIGVDMTPEMLSKARLNADKGGYSNVEFRLGEIENIPVADAVVDVVMSNCVINLSPNKPRVYEEAFRILKPGGRLAISDIVAIVPLNQKMRQDLEQWSGCASGAEPIERIKKMLKQQGFESIRIQQNEKSRDFIKEWAPGLKLEKKIVSATIEARKPG